MTLYLWSDNQDWQARLAAERPRLLRLCTALVGDAEAAEDVVQETMIEAWRHIGQLRDPAAFPSWLSGIARNVGARWLRARGRAFSVSEPLPDGNGTEGEPAAPPAWEWELERQELVALLDQALALLPPATRGLLVQRYLEESPQATLAAQLGLSENALAVRLHRGKVALREVLSTELHAQAVTLGLVEPGEVWQTTRIWCTRCGQRHLLGRFTVAEFLLRCPACAVEPDAFHSQSNVETVLAGVKGFRPALTRFTVWMNGFFQGAMEQGSVPCQRCGVPTPLRLGLPASAPHSVRTRRGLHVRCDGCGASSYETLDGMALGLPEGRRFFRAHPRLRTLPEREIEWGGTPALVVGFAGVHDPATFDVIVQRETYRVLAVEGGSDG